MAKREPNFDNLLKVLANETPERPTLYEFFLNADLYTQLAGWELSEDDDDLTRTRHLVDAFTAAGYDYASVAGSKFMFPRPERHAAKSKSMDENAPICDRASFEAIPWEDPDDFSYERLDQIRPDLPDGLKLVVHGPGGVLENIMELMGFTNLSIIMAEDPELMDEIAEAVGGRLLRHYQLVCEFDTVGACMVNDDWGFKTQTMLRPEAMRRWIIPWHKRIVEHVHASGRPAIMHSCGNLDGVMDDVIDDIRFDAKHSFEDAIIPIEEALTCWGDRIALLGGIDVDFLIRAPIEDIQARCRSMLDWHERGGYALGSGNSIPAYVPSDRYFAMTRVWLDAR